MYEIKAFLIIRNFWYRCGRLICDFIRNKCMLKINCIGKIFAKTIFKGIVNVISHPQLNLG